MPKLSRVCPLCEKAMDDLSCVECNVPSVELSMMEEGDETLTEGMVIADRYRIEKVLGRGAMGSVYEATQLSVDRTVAIKTLQKQLLNEYRLVQRFYREARAASQLDHPNVIQTYDFGIDPATNVPYIAMEYLDGYELTDMIDERHALPEEETCAILGQVAAGLVEAHEKGVIHRDLKPQNIRVRVLSDGELQAKVLDFGIAKVVRDQDSGGTLTGTGMTVGTPPYMSPEQILGEGIDQRADLYSLGCILHECLTGRLPFWSEDRLSIVTLHLTGKRPQLPELLCDGNPPTQALRDLHRCLLARHKTERPPHARIVAKVLKKLAVGKSVDVKKIMLSATTHEQATPLEKRRSDRNVALLSGRTDESLKTGTAMSTDEAQVVASAATMVAMSTDEPLVSDPLMTGPEIPSDTSSVDLSTFVKEEAAYKGEAQGNKFVLFAALAAALLAVVLIGVLGGGDDTSTDKKTAETDDSSQVSVANDNENQQAGAPSTLTSAGRTAPATKSGKSTENVDVQLKTTPPGVSVEIGGEYLGETPLAIGFTGKTAKRLVRLSRDGYRSQTVVVERSHVGPYNVVMKKERAATSGRKPVKRARRQSAGKAKGKPAPKAVDINKDVELDSLPGAAEALEAMEEGQKAMESQIRGLEKAINPNKRARGSKKTQRAKKSGRAVKTKKTKKKPVMDLW